MFFSVKRPLKIAGKRYIPCICYEVTTVLEETIKKLAEEDKAVIYDERVFFQNGKVIPTEKMLKEEKKKERKLMKNQKNSSLNNETNGF